MGALIKTAAQILAEIEDPQPVRNTPVLTRKPYTGIKQPCKIHGCEGMTGGNGTGWGWCRRHYDRWRAYGDPNGHSPNINQCRSKWCNHGKGT